MSRVLTRPVVAVPQNPDSVPAAERSPSRVRTLHPLAWWAWAAAAAAAISSTRNPLLVVLVLASVVLVATARRSQDPWGQSVRAYLWVALAIIGIRLVLQALVGSFRHGVVLIRLPEIALPTWLAGIHLGGPVTLDGVLFSVYDAARLAGIVVCVGAANALANPRRTLRTVPSALYELSVAVVIALSLAPELVASTLRVRSARRLRGGTSRSRWRGLDAVVVPVIEDALESSLALATSMTARGFGRTRAAASPAVRWVLIASLGCVTVGTFALFGLPSGLWWGVGLLTTGALLSLLGLRAAGRAVQVTRYRPDPWGSAEWRVLVAAVLGAGAALALAHWAPDLANPGVSPPTWPALHPIMVVSAAAFAAPLFLAPRPQRQRATPERRVRQTTSERRVRQNTPERRVRQTTRERRVRR